MKKAAVEPMWLSKPYKEKKGLKFFEIVRLTFHGMMALFCLSQCILNFSIFLADYLTYPSVLNIEVQNGASLTFPAVTICNLNRMKMRTLKRICCVFQKSDILGVCNTFSTDLRVCSMSSVTPTSNIPKSSPRMLLALASKYPKTEEEQRAINVTLAYLSLNTSFRDEIGFQKDDMIKHCSYMGESCLENFTKFWTFLYGNCFTFNAHRRGDTRDLKVESAGMLSGLQIGINYQRSEYVYLDSTSIGVRVVVHSSDIVPNVENDGVDIEPETITSIALKQVATRRLPEPYSDRCGENINSNRRTYNRELCLQDCMQQLNMANCGCGDPTVALPDEIPPCLLNVTSYISCLDDTRQKLSSGQVTCDCPLACFEYGLEMVISSSSLIMNQMEVASQTSSSLTDMQNIKLRVYFQTTETIIYTSSPKYKIQDIYANLGGQMGMWLGVSLNSCFQFIMSLIGKIHTALNKVTPTSSN
ncbi:epithelial sodium channel subunit gamma-like [Tachypleus tridentatus]|uniref:epithelial sodium channel subunit gamma-like n=1 Tax=Tachypleus tridentatus TaxID=6853 RepID=UPI003FD475A4